MAESDVILRRKMNNDDMSKRRIKIAPARRRRRSARPNARRRPASEWDDPNLNPGVEDLRPPSSESESESESESLYGDEEVEEYEEVSGGMGPRIAAGKSRGGSLPQSACRQPVNRMMRQEEAPDLMQVRGGDEPPEGYSSSTAPAPLSQEEKLKQSLGRIEDWVKILEGRAANWKRVQAGAMQHLAVSIEAWHAQDPTLELPNMRSLPYNTPTSSGLLPWISGALKKKETAARERKVVQEELARAQHHAGVLREERPDPRTAQAEKYAAWAYQQTLRGDPGSESTQPYPWAARNPDPPVLDIVDLDNDPKENRDGQALSPARPEVIVIDADSNADTQTRLGQSVSSEVIIDWTQPAIIDMTGPAEIVVDMTAETAQPPTQRITRPDRRWNPSRDPINFRSQRESSPPAVRRDQRRDLFSFSGINRFDQQWNPFPGMPRSGQRRDQLQGTDLPDRRWNPSMGTINFRPMRNQLPPAAVRNHERQRDIVPGTTGPMQQLNPFSAAFGSDQRRNPSPARYQRRPKTRPVEINPTVFNVFDGPVSNISQLERERALRREQESSRRKRKRESDRQNGADGGREPDVTGGPDGSRDGREGGRSYDAEADPKRRKLEDEMNAYKARELEKINKEGEAWEEGVLSWVALKAKHLFE
ncbi:uncharacterized protein PgNI_01945 [Pyricularia grisea]|uniref:Uncharacterized protein n=1 Tax=Pyricularia grisea TaxID=148305 RepID=A0A6P8BKK6_PYRGI|nr:uncharacterized protein PgNI_01945 [Pyricularia grisea]TLD17426.1 hypothetical protein PgNI_01945 [Pyricularia grisea]